MKVQSLMKTTEDMPMLSKKVERSQPLNWTTDVFGYALLAALSVAMFCHGLGWAWLPATSVTFACTLTYRQWRKDNRAFTERLHVEYQPVKLEPVPDGYRDVPMRANGDLHHIAIRRDSEVVAGLEITGDEKRDMIEQYRGRSDGKLVRGKLFAGERYQDVRSALQRAGYLTEDNLWTSSGLVWLDIPLPAAVGRNNGSVSRDDGDGDGGDHA